MYEHAKKNLLVRHAIGGRTFFDAAQSQASFRMEELNVFLFEELEGGYYIVPSSVAYNKEGRLLTMRAARALPFFN